MNDLSVPDVLGATGPLAARLDNFAERAGQIAMARDVATLVRTGGALACEAGTGTGKTIAYLVPLLCGERRAIVSTGTRNLQDQLFFRDLPVVHDALGARVTVALLKGRGNYLCLHRLHAFLEQGRFGDRRVLAHLTRIRAWSTHTGNGDIAELDEVPEDSPAWRYATSTPDNCLGPSCAWFDQCHLFEARRRAMAADLVVVNHHLLLAQLALTEEGADLLPEAAVLVVDEAHQLPDLATEFFGETLTAGQLLELSRDADTARRIEAPDMPDLSALAAEVERRTRSIRIILEAQPRRVARAELAQHEAFHVEVAALAAALSSLAAGFGAAAGRGRALASCEQRAQALEARLAMLEGADGDEYLSWLDVTPRGFTWRRSPLDVGPLLGPRLAARHAALLFTSATLAVAGKLDHFTDSLGLDACEHRIYASPFDYQQQALLYLPRGMSEPRAPEFAQQLHRCIRDVVQACGGRTFVLFTSHRALAQAHASLVHELSFPVLAQGEAPRGQLLEHFRNAGNAVLFGTYSFWEGVDVRGEALSCVIIDKLPFAPPDDPLLRARHRAIREQGRDPFNEQQLPQAAIALKQGVGRLIRDASDRGVVVICDPRLHQKGYGRRLLASLPPMALTREMDEVRAFFQRAEDGDGYTARDGEPPPTPVRSA